jgi:hypothetical protein
VVQFSSSVSALITEKERELRSFNDFRISALEEAAQEAVSVACGVCFPVSRPGGCRSECEASFGVFFVAEFFCFHTVFLFAFPN